MGEVPEVRYARSGDVHVAYQTFGRGPHLVSAPPFVQNLEMLWDDPTGGYPRFLRRLAEYRTVTIIDKRGTGLSDRVSGMVGVEERMDDLRAVMDAIGAETAALTGISEGGPLAMLFAATYPERVEALVLVNTAARFVAAPDHPYGPTPELFDQFVEELVARWGTPESIFIPFWTPSLRGDPELRTWMARYERAGASPGAIREHMAWVREIDVRAALPALRCPTLILQRVDDGIVTLAQGRVLAEALPDATFVELPGGDHPPWVGDIDGVLDEVERFLTGDQPQARPSERVLATVLFTDIVASTERAVAEGDERWRSLLDRHDALVRRILSVHDGREVKTMGDGFLAVFDSPSRAVRAATAITGGASGLGLDVRCGVHTGEVERRGDDVAGLGVHIGARIAALAGPAEVLVSGTVRDLVIGSELVFEDRGLHQLKGVAGEWPLLRVRA